LDVIFDSVAIYDEKSQAIKFAGRVVNGRNLGHFVICKVPKSVLEERFNLQEPGAGQLLECYMAAQAQINALAVQKAKLGDYRPVITARELWAT